MASSVVGRPWVPSDAECRGSGKDIDSGTPPGGTLDLPGIIARATFLRERILACGHATHAASDGPASAVARWRASVEPDGSDWFEKRLRWDGLEASELVADGDCTGGEGAPTWALILHEIATAARAARGQAEGTLESTAAPGEAAIPFEHLLLPAVVVARSRLAVRLGFAADESLRFPIHGIVLPPAYGALERALLRQLSDIAGATLLSELRRAQPLGRALVLRFGASDPAEDADYRELVDRHLDDGWSGLLHEYPVLGRLIATAVDLWATTTAELVRRLASDRVPLAGLLGVEPDTLEVSDFDTSVADRHRGGRSVVVVSLGDRKVVYKPKPLRMEAGFNRLIAWCNERGASPHLRVTTILDRGEYGWAEHVDHLACASERAAERFYQRAGMLLCLLDLARATDCHFENVIAHGDQPVLVDAETLLYPDPQPLETLDELGAGEGAERLLLTASVLRTGMLPRWQAGEDETSVVDNSALGGPDSHPPRRARPRWRHVNTDAMHVEVGSEDSGLSGNAVRIGDRRLSAGDYEEQLTAGFASMYRLLMAHRDGLSAPDGPLASLGQGDVRFMYRPTRLYQAVSASSQDPRLLRSGIDYGIHLEQLARAFLVSSDRPSTWPVLAAEIRALEQLDVPVFQASADGTAARLEDGSEIPDAFTRPSRDAMFDRVVAMSAVG